MALTSVSSAYSYPKDPCDTLRQVTDDFERLARALNSGDLAGARKAFEAFKQGIQNVQRIKDKQHIIQTGRREQENRSEVTSANDTGIGTLFDVMA